MLLAENSEEPIMNSVAQRFCHLIDKDLDSKIFSRVAAQHPRMSAD